MASKREFEQAAIDFILHLEKTRALARRLARRGVGAARVEQAVSALNALDWICENVESELEGVLEYPACTELEARRGSALAEQCLLEARGEFVPPDLQRRADAELEEVVGRDKDDDDQWWRGGGEGVDG